LGCCLWAETSRELAWGANLRRSHRDLLLCISTRRAPCRPLHCLGALAVEPFSRLKVLTGVP